MYIDSPVRMVRFRATAAVLSPDEKDKTPKISPMVKVNQDGHNSWGKLQKSGYEKYR